MGCEGRPGGEHDNIQAYYLCIQRVRRLEFSTKKSSNPTTKKHEMLSSSSGFGPPCIPRAEPAITAISLARQPPPPAPCPLGHYALAARAAQAPSRRRSPPTSSPTTCSKAPSRRPGAPPRTPGGSRRSSATSPASGSFTLDTTTATVARFRRSSVTSRTSTLYSCM
jgi:hypothetical protein